MRHNKKSILLITIFLMGILLHAPVVAGYIPYVQIYKALRDQRTVTAQIADRLTLNAVRRAILFHDPENLARISSACFTGHVYLVGQPDTAENRDELVRLVRSVPNVRSVGTYLPLPSEIVPGDASKINISFALWSDKKLPDTTLEIHTIGGAAVLTGMVSDNTVKELVEQRVSQVDEVKKVVNLLLLITPEYEKRLLRPLESPLRRLIP